MKKIFKHISNHKLMYLFLLIVFIINTIVTILFEYNTITKQFKNDIFLLLIGYIPFFFQLIITYIFTKFTSNFKKTSKFILGILNLITTSIIIFVTFLEQLFIVISQEL